MKALMTVTIALMVLLWVAQARAAVAEEGDPGNSDGVILARCFLRVDGSGSFSANHRNTSYGAVDGWFFPDQPITLRAVAAPGWEFSHWTFCGNDGGSSAESTVVARKGLLICAHFVKK